MLPYINILAKPIEELPAIQFPSTNFKDSSSYDTGYEAPPPPYGHQAPSASEYAPQEPTYKEQEPQQYQAAAPVYSYSPEYNQYNPGVKYLSP